MGEFKRGLSDVKWATLQSLHDAKTDNWWKDLLSLWKPSGTPAGDDGLRLAVRDGYLNFYRRGQSVALVCFGAERGGKVEARMEIHAKYICKNFEDQAYAKLIGNEVVWKGSKSTKSSSMAYEGVEKTLKVWIAATNRPGGNEKRSVDAIVGNNSVVIDMEMALPAWAHVKSALRVDLISLRRDGTTPTLMLCEVKPLDSGHLRSKDGEAAILAQMKNYRDYLDSKERRAAVRSAYMRSCSELVRFAKMAKKDLDPIIHEASQALEVEREPALILCKGISSNDLSVGYDVGGWEKEHRGKLDAAKVRMVIAEDAARLELGSV